MRLEICFVLLATAYNVVVGFEYGSHKVGEVKSYEFNSTVPLYVPIHRINITHGRTDVDSDYTYLKVYTLTIAAHDPIIIFDSEQKILTFFVRYPLYTISFIVIGYSMPLKGFTGVPVNLSTTEIPHLTLPSDLPEFKYKYANS